MSEKTKYVVHLHHAKRAGTHWDLRILRYGRLKSWAIPKHKLPEKGERLFAARTPDHSFTWYDWEGVIEDGYGKGKVEIYEQGEVEILFWRPDRIGLNFSGIKLKGIFYLVKVVRRNPKNPKVDPWLFIKGK